MQKNVWLKRDERGLATTLAELKRSKERFNETLYPSSRDMQDFMAQEALEAINLLLCAQIMTTAALTRKESRGSHQRSDYPDIDNRKWLKNIILWRDKGRMTVRTEPVTATEVPLPKE
jgi:succinate dehydrogenase / fumarate reductase flavoprotein subunit